MIQGICLTMVALVLASAGRTEEAGVAPAPAARSPVLERLARAIEPDLIGRPDRLQQYVDSFQRELGNDARLFAFNVVAVTGLEGRVRLRGYVEFPETRAGLADLLGILGFAVVDELETFPSASLGEHTLGFVKTSHSLSYDRPAGQRSAVTDCLLGDRVYLLREEQGQLLVHSHDGYLGYVPVADVHRVDESAFVRYLADASVRMTTEHQATSGLVIPAGARLKWARTDGETVTAELPTGELVTLPATCCQVRSGRNAEVDRIIESARQLLGTRYLWGGKTTSGIDCSGLVQVAFATSGLNLPRDSNQQFLMGELTATRWHTAGMRPGDTLYFLGEHGRIRHTAIYLGDDRYLQAEMPMVSIRSLNPAHDDYDSRRRASFAFAKRLLD